ncbi:MAG: ABC transporter ATP-binding protein [Eubacteriales bacterium]|nr:ABC transporter ATP-binding protein [Eubacteriales bacterium]
MAEYILETRGLGISFGGLKAAQDVNLRVKKREIYGLIGPNGAGKTTVFNMLTGVYKPTAGEILLDGVRIDGMGQEKINRLGIARTFQNIRLFNNMTVVRNVMVGLHNSPKYNTNLAETVLRLPKHFRVEKEMREEAKSFLRIFGLEDVRNELAANLPYGKQRKLEIARALATGPKLLLLDEPAAGMNPHETDELTATIRQVRERFDMTILLIEHDMSLVSGICDELTVLNFGTVLAQGRTAEVLKNPDVVKAYLGD